MIRTRGEDGFVMLVVLVLMLVTLGLGTGMMFFADSQQRASGRERARESGFNLAEAAVNSQLFELSRQWPSTAATAYPSSCTAATSTPTNGCPDAGGLSHGYPRGPVASCPAGTTADAWGAPITTQWTTYVRDDGGGTGQLYNSSVVSTQPSYDANGDGAVWVRSVAVSQCSVRTIITLVSEQLTTLSFPTSALSANWFATSNQGNKVLLDTQGTAAQAGGVSMRCTGLALPLCEVYRAGQVSPDTTTAPANPGSTLTATQLAAVKANAVADGTYFPAGTCPASLGALSGAPVYVENCNLGFTGGTANSAASPGWLVLAQGSLDLNGNATYYGTVYAVNGQGSPLALVTLHGNSLLQGSVAVDGLGGVQLGSSGANLTYDTGPFANIRAYAGATATPGTFRLLAAGQ